MSAAHRVVFTMVAILVVAAIAVLALRAGGAGIGLGPDAGQTTDASPSVDVTVSAAPSASADPSPGASVPDEAEAQVILAEIEEQVIAIRGLEAADIGPAEIISRDELAAELQQ